MPANTPKSTAGRVLLLFAFLFAGVVAARWKDGQRRSQLESIDYPTALGDENTAPLDVLSGAEFTAWTQQEPTEAAWHVVSSSPDDIPPDRLLKIGAAAGGAFWLYEPDAKFPRHGTFIRTADAKFLRVQKHQP